MVCDSPRDGILVGVGGQVVAKEADVLKLQTLLQYIQDGVEALVVDSVVYE